MRASGYEGGGEAHSLVTSSPLGMSVESSGCQRGMPRWIRSARMSIFCREPAGAVVAVNSSVLTGSKFSSWPYS